MSHLVPVFHSFRKFLMSALFAIFPPALFLVFLVFLYVCFLSVLSCCFTSVSSVHSFSFLLWHVMACHFIHLSISSIYLFYNPSFNWEAPSSPISPSSIFGPSICHTPQLPPLPPPPTNHKNNADGPYSVHLLQTIASDSTGIPGMQTYEARTQPGLCSCS